MINDGRQTKEVDGLLNSIDSPLKDCSMERSPKELLMFALQRHEVTQINEYRVYTDFSDPSVVVVLVHERVDEAMHKYIFARSADKTYIVAAPMKWFCFHRHLLEMVSMASGQNAHCSGGGFVIIREDGKMLCSGHSTDFGKGDHRRAKEAFERAVRASSAPTSEPDVTPDSSQYPAP
jgi:hypothetical protein